jgi:hypothetical protein
MIFGTHPIGLIVWLFTVPFALGMLILEEFRKKLARRETFFGRNVLPKALKT